MRLCLTLRIDILCTEYACGSHTYNLISPERTSSLSYANNTEWPRENQDQTIDAIVSAEIQVTQEHFL